jgi:type II secretory pathway pseudopilin PulG
MRRSLRPAGRGGFTLFELLVVLALIILIMAMALPSIEGMSPYFKTSAAVDQIRGRWNDARSRAIEEGRPYRFGVKPGESGYRIAPDTPEFWGGSPGSSSTSNGGNSDDSAAKPLILEEDLPEGVTFNLNGNSGGGGGNNANPANGTNNANGASVSGNTAGGYSAVVTFLPDGTASDDVDLQFQATGTRAMGLKIRALTGSITAVKSQGGKSP